ncbi:hypothetical protein SLNSH_17560 [Alsobacter soli]|uniref:Uncharacterized protein n=2 Tax=Alsobacter soli TaxID=2109933 RepID=A0A2T1HQ01_9HYPH|nr:hypothetical protein SLNSH_17560 [Alsobacter soli]
MLAEWAATIAVCDRELEPYAMKPDHWFSGQRDCSLDETVGYILHVRDTLAHLTESVLEGRI